jgi:integrase
MIKDVIVHDRTVGNKDGRGFSELCLLRLRDIQSRQGVMHLQVTGKRSKIRYVPITR